MAQYPISCNNGNLDTLGVLSLASRPRFGSAPATANFSLPPPLQDQRQHSAMGLDCPSPLWTRIGDGAKILHQSSRHYVRTYTSNPWQAPVLAVIDFTYKFVNSKVLQRQRPHWRFTSENYIGQIRMWSNWLLTGAVAALVIMLSLLLLAIITSKLVLPFYSIFGLVYWLLTWWKSSNDSSRSTKETSSLILYWWYASAVLEIAALLVWYLIADAFILFDGWHGLLATAVVVPLVAFASSLIYLDYYVRVPQSSLRKSQAATKVDRTEQLLYFISYLALTYAIRHFSIRGFTLLPAIIRPFVGYLACHCATVAFEKELSWSTVFDLINCKCTRAPCDHCHAPRPSASQPMLNNAMPLPKTSITNRTHSFLDSDLRYPHCGRSQRRVSLPAGPLAPMRQHSNISEARGLITDMLAQKDMPPYLVSGLKAVSSLLSSANPSNNFLFSPHFDIMGNLPRVFDTPYIGADLDLSRVEAVGQRRQSPIVVTWSTTTSATGLPTVEPEPSRARSSSYWKHRHMGGDGATESKEAVTPQCSLEVDSTLIQLSDGTMYSLMELETDSKLARLEEWSLPIFDMYLDSPETLLTRVGYTIFQRSDFFRIFKISKQKFFSFFHALEKGYWEIPYHNRIHAADVMHATYYFASSKVPAMSTIDTLAIMECRDRCNSQNRDDEKDIEDERRMDESNDLTRVLLNGLEESMALDQKNAGSLASVLSSLEVMALYTAAAMHDYDHPGRTNAFLVAVQDEKCILYNDRSVLENHHAAASWQLLNKPENNFVDHLDTAEFKRFRYMVIEAILATDLKRHFDILMDFNGKVGSQGLDWDNESDKLLTCQICIKMADINSPTKSHPLHQEWTNRIVEEFYAQGDDEQRRSLPVSPYMDRQDPQLAKLQDSFITHLVAPLVQAMNDAGLLTLSPAPIQPEPMDTDVVPKSELVTNLELNQKYWKAQLDDPGEPTVLSASATAVDDLEMETIQEQDDENGSSSPTDVST